MATLAHETCQLHPGLNPDLLLTAAWSAVFLAAVEAVGATPLHGGVIGAVVGTLIVAWQPLQTLVDETRHSAGIHTDVA